MKIVVVDLAPLMRRKMAIRNRVLAIDQATSISGYSVFDNGDLVEYGTFESKGKDSVHRIADVKEWLRGMVKEWDPELVALEDIQLQSPGGSAAIGVQTFKILAHLQGVLMNCLNEMKIPFILCSPSSWRAHSSVKGKTKSDKKRSMIQIVEKKFGAKVTNDEADAIGIGLFATEKF